MTPWSTMADHSPSIEIQCDSEIHAMAFTPDGQYLLAGDDDGFGVWRVQDGKQMKRIASIGLVHCLSVSRNGRQFAVGTSSGAIVWDAATFEPIFARPDVGMVTTIDLSPDGTRLVLAPFNAYMAMILDVARDYQRLVQTFCHGCQVIAAKYSPRGDLIATATHASVRVWDGSDGRLLMDTPVDVTPEYNNGLIWSEDNCVLVIAFHRIKKFEASTGSELWECPIPSSIGYSCLALLQRGEFIAYSTTRTITFWHTSTQTQLTEMHHPHNLFFVALSPDDQFLAIGGRDGKITIKRLSCISVPDLHIDAAALDSWKRDQFEHAEALLTASRIQDHHVLASRALVRARLRQWDAALVDAEMSIKAKPSVIGYIAKSIALVGKGEKHDGYQACDIAFEYFRSHVSFLLLIKAITFYMIGEHRTAISRMDDLIAAFPLDSMCYVVQAYMYLLYGQSQTECGDYNAAVQSFGRARAKLRHHTRRQFWAVSLISGWKFEGLDISVDQHLCEALHAADRTKDASEYLFAMVNALGKAVYTSASIAKWVSDFTAQCLSTPQVDNNATSKTAQQSKAVRVASAPLLKEWVKATVASCSWKDALIGAASFIVPRFTTYRAVYEHLEAAGRSSDASECLRQMVAEMVQHENSRDPQLEWVLDKLECLGDISMGADLYHIAISHYSAALALHPPTPQDLFIKRSRAYVVSSLWKEALDDANKVIELDPSSPWGYARKCEALHQAGDDDNAMDAFEALVLTISQSPDLDILGDLALGRLLAQLLTTSGDTTVLAWSGRSGSFNSCFPANIDVFDALPTSHIPREIPDAEMETMITKMRASRLNITSVVNLYDRLSELPHLSVLGRRIKLPCIFFNLGPVLPTQSTSGRVFRAKTGPFGAVEIKAREDLSRLGFLVLVHPWIDFLLDRRPAGGFTEMDLDGAGGQSARLMARLRRPFGSHTCDASLPPPVLPVDKQTQALRFIARLKQPFSALLLAPAGRDSGAWKRAATANVICVRVRGDTPLNVLISGVRTLDVV